MNIIKLINYLYLSYRLEKALKRLSFQSRHRKHKLTNTKYKNIHICYKVTHMNVKTALAGLSGIAYVIWIEPLDRNYNKTVKKTLKLEDLILSLYWIFHILSPRLSPFVVLSVPVVASRELDTWHCVPSSRTALFLCVLPRLSSVRISTCVSSS